MKIKVWMGITFATLLVSGGLLVGTDGLMQQEMTQVPTGIASDDPYEPGAPRVAADDPYEPGAPWVAADDPYEPGSPIVG